MDRLRWPQAFARALAGAALVLWAAAAQSHAVSTAYVRLAAAQDRPAVRVDLPLRDLDDLVGIDADGDGRITWREVQAAEPRIAAVVAAGVSVARGNAACRFSPRPIAIDVHAGTPHAVYNAALDCAGTGAWAVDYRLLFDRDRTHRALLAVTADGVTTGAVLDAEHRGWRAARSGFSLFLDFVRQGMWHIWLGYDHLAFLFLLLLPAVLERGRGGWEPVPSRRMIVVRVLKVVTAFTAAHSITLSLAALGVLTPPAAPIEAAIAVTVILAGVANLVPRLAVHGAVMAFAFGLIHGFGFANALAELGLKAGAIAAPLAGFNIGVELGQLAVVALALPALVALRSTRHYALRVMPGASLATILLAIGWLVQRIGVI
jgi:hypothetical protein